MELGALVCSPTNPLCAECPLAAFCEARAKGETARFPELAPRAKARSRRDLALAFFERGRLLIGKRRADEVWGGLWELPRVTLLEGESHEDAARRLGREILGCAATLGEREPYAKTKHTVMSERIELVVLEGRLRGKPRARGHAELRRVSEAELLEMALPSPVRRVAASLFVSSARTSERGK
jgi:A/G-specific adenine glycosylase